METEADKKNRERTQKEREKEVIDKAIRERDAQPGRDRQFRAQRDQKAFGTYPREEIRKDVEDRAANEESREKV